MAVECRNTGKAGCCANEAGLLEGHSRAYQDGNQWGGGAGGWGGGGGGGGGGGAPEGGLALIHQAPPHVLKQGQALCYWPVPPGARLPVLPTFHHKQSYTK